VGATSAALATAVGAQTAGAAAELFGFPSRVLHREWWLQPVIQTDTAITDEAFWAAQAHPGVDRRMKFSGKRVSLEDNEGLFVRVQGVGSGNTLTIVNGAFMLSWIICYKQVW